MKILVRKFKKLIRHEKQTQNTSNAKRKVDKFKLPSKLEKNGNIEISKKESNKTFISWNKSDMDSSNESEKAKKSQHLPHRQP